MALQVRMTPAKPRKAAKSRKPAGKASGRKGTPSKAAKKAAPRPAKSSKGGKPSAAKPAKGSKAGSAKPTASATGHAHCAATDPFGDPCQNVPRRPSKYCVIHSYLDR
jgi:hypothetical protein